MAEEKKETKLADKVTIKCDGYIFAKKNAKSKFEGEELEAHLKQVEHACYMCFKNKTYPRKMCYKYGKPKHIKAKEKLDAKRKKALATRKKNEKYEKKKLEKKQRDMERESLDILEEEEE